MLIAFEQDSLFNRDQLYLRSSALSIVISFHFLHKFLHFNSVENFRVKFSFDLQMCRAQCVWLTAWCATSTPPSVTTAGAVSTTAYGATTLTVQVGTATAQLTLQK